MPPHLLLVNGCHLRLVNAYSLGCRVVVSLEGLTTSLSSVERDPELLERLAQRLEVIVGDRDGARAQAIAQPGAGVGVLEQAVEQRGVGQGEDEHPVRFQRRDPRAVDEGNEVSNRRTAGGMSPPVRRAYQSDRPAP